ncbi:MAG TPA: hypothetical protein VF868_01310 [Bacteroidia bacterium]|jgi:hypothetical protein
MKIFRLLFLLLLPICSHAQSFDSVKVLGIHPAVGKLITADEKVKYKLFPEYKDSTFESARVLKYNDSLFVLCVRSINGTELTKDIGTDQLDKLYYAVEELEKQKKPREDYVMSDEEKRETERRRSRNNNSEFWWNFLAQMTILTFETLIAFAFIN